MIYQTVRSFNNSSWFKPSSDDYFPVSTVYLHEDLSRQTTRYIIIQLKNFVDFKQISAKLLAQRLSVVGHRSPFRFFRRKFARNSESEQF